MRTVVIFCLAALALQVAHAQQCSGQVSGVTWTPASRVPGAASQSIVVGFTVATALAATDLVTINYPNGFITTASATIAPDTFTTPVTPGATTIVLTVATGKSVAAGASVLVTLSGVTMGPVTTVGSCTGISVLTTTNANPAVIIDSQSAGVDSGSLGGQITGVSWTLESRNPGDTNKKVTIVFKVFTALAQTDVVTITYPSGFFATSPNPTVLPATFNTPVTPGSTQILLVVATGQSVAAGATVTVTLSGMTMGTAPIAENAANIAGLTVGPTTTATPITKDIASAPVSSGPLGGQVTGVTMTIAAADLLPGASKPVTVVFTPASALTQAASHVVTIGFPLNYITAVTSVASATNFLGTTATVQNPATSLTIPVGSGNIAAGTAVTLTLTGATIAGNMAAGCSAGIWVSTSRDLRSTNTVSTQAIGGTVTAVSSTIAVADRVPLGTTKQVTVSFTIQTALANGNSVTINFAGANGGLTNYLTAVTGVTFATANVFAFGSSSGNGATLTVGSAGAGAGTAYTVTLTGVTIGAVAAATTNGITVSTTNDAAGSGPTVAIGGSITGVAVSIAAADRVPGTVNKPVTVSFTTRTALTSGQLVTITWPTVGSGSYLSGTIAVVYGGAANTFAGTTTAVTNPSGVTIAVGTAGAAAASYTITLTGGTIGVAATPFAATTGACGNNFFVSTPNDLQSGTNAPALGGQVTGVSFNVASTTPTATGKTVTVSFTTQTALASGATVSIGFPNLYISAAIGVTYAGATNTFVSSATVGSTGLTIAVGSAGAAPASYTVTLTGATMGGPMAANTLTGVSVSTTNDAAGVTGYPALGGAVTGTTLTIAPVDRIAATNRKLVVSFTTTTALVQNNVITVMLPSGLVSAVTTGAVTGITANAALSGNNILLTVGSGGLAAAATSTVTICGVTLGSFLTNNLIGVQVTTTSDYSTVCSATGTVGVSSQVTAVSMTMPFTDRVASKTGVAVTFSFTTATALPVIGAGSCNAQNNIVITFPTSFFVNNQAASTCGSGATVATISAQGVAGYGLPASAIGPSSSTTFSLSGTAALSAGTYTVTIIGLTLGSQTAGNDAGVTVSTTEDGTSSGAPSGPISGYQVTSVSMPSCQSSTCQNFVIGFSSAGAASTIAANGNLAITFTNAAGTAVNVLSGAPDAFMSGSALITGAVSSNTLTLTAASNSGAWALGATTTLTLTGMTVASSGFQTGPIYVSVGTSTPAYSLTVSPTGTGKTTTTSLTIARPFPGVTNTQVTIVFSTTVGIGASSTIRIFYPTGFFISAPQVGPTCALTNSYNLGASGLAACSTLTPSAPGTIGRAMTPTGSAAITATNPSISYIDVSYSGTATAAGTQTVVLSGVTLSATAVPATNFFSVVTSENSCSAGMISTGAISNSNPGGPSAPAATASSVFLSAAAALACALLLLL